MTIERHMFPRQAESVDSFPTQPAIRQPEAAERTSESPKPIGLSRRGMIAGLAVLPVALAAAAEVVVDPAFALIAAKRAVDVAHIAAIDVQTEAEKRFGSRSAEAWEAFKRSGDACVAVNKIAWKLATTPPTTLGGVAAVLRFANQLEDEGEEWPDTDAIGPEGWHYQLRKTMADALEAIMRQAAGGLT